MAQHFEHSTRGADFTAGHRPRSAQTGWLTSEPLQRARRWLIVAGVASLIIGIVAVAVPVLASVTVTIFFGWILIAGGLALGVHAVSHRVWVRGLEAAITFVAGLYILLFPLSGTVTLTFVLAAWLFASGILSLVYGIQWRDSAGNWTYIFSGALSVIVGLLIALGLPSSAAWAIGLLVGINLIIWGVRALTGAWLLKRLTTAELDADY
jgi:uncharacterized membrane protein HdeD (DUF308 family)